MNMLHYGSAHSGLEAFASVRNLTRRKAGGQRMWARTPGHRLEATTENSNPGICRLLDNTTFPAVELSRRIE